MTAAKKTDKKPKEENPLVLNAEVVGGNWRHRKLGRIVRVTKSLLHVRWDNGTTGFFSRRGQSFVGKVDEKGEAITSNSAGRAIEDIWDSDDTLEIATEGAKARIEEERAAKSRTEQERAAKNAALEADPVYQKRQADLKRYAEMLAGLGANVENGWGDQNDFRVELDGIVPEKMDALVEAIRKVLA